MDTSTKDTLVKAIQLIKTGDKNSAVPLLASVLKKEPSLVQAWYLLGLAVDSDAQKIKSFKQALKLDPGHEKARQALAKLEIPSAAPEFVPDPDPEPVSFLPVAEEPPPVVDEHSTGPLDESLLEYQSGFPEEPEPVEEAQEMDLRAELGSQPDYEPTEDLPAERLDQEPASQQAPVHGDEFTLPEWMSESSFDPDEYQAEQPADEIYENTEEDIPEWARSNPFDAQGTPIEPKPKPQPDMPAWASMIPPKDQRPAEEDSFDEEEDDLPSWAGEEDTPLEDDAPDQYAREGSDIDRVAAFFEQEDSRSQGQSGEEDPEEPDWLSGMTSEGEDGKKKKSKRQRKERTPSQKKKRRQTIFRILLLVLILGGAAGGYFFREELQPYWAKVKPYTDIVVNPVKTFAAPVTDLLTQGAPLTYLLTPDYNVTPTITNTPPSQPTAEPAWTPQATDVPSTPTLIPALNPDQTATVTPTSSPLPNEIEAQMEEIETQIEILRGLSGPITLNREFVNLSNLRQEMELQLIDADRLDEFEDDLLLLRALGFIRGDVNLADPLLNTFADAAGGFYSPESNKIQLIGSYFDGFGEIEQYIYALEYVHALQDNNFNLSNLGYFPDCSQSTQECQAMKALVKGEAALVLQLWLEKNPPTNIAEINNYEYSPTLFGPAEPAPFFTKDAEFGTTHGLAFVEYLYENGGWNAVDRAFNILPRTTEQILHPEKYQQREEAGSIVYPSYTDLLGQEWELLREDSLGEWYTYLLLGYNDFPTGQRPDNEAAVAAEGWSVDRYQLYYHPEVRQTFLSVYWIWDTEEDSNQFYTALDASLDARFGGAAEELSDGGKCWTFGGEKSCIQQNGPKVYWLLSENADMVDLIRGRFNVFP